MLQSLRLVRLWPHQGREDGASCRAHGQDQFSEFGPRSVSQRDVQTRNQPLGAENLQSQRFPPDPGPPPELLRLLTLVGALTPRSPARNLTLSLVFGEHTQSLPVWLIGIALVALRRREFGRSRVHGDPG